ncbi:MAG: sigma 54-interacting transcriptional regulator [Planctomycetota bacterium]|jgi:two-component system NtrC family response regulator
MLEKILVVGRQLQAQQLARSFTQRLYAADNAGDIWALIESSDPDLILFDADVPHDTIHQSLDVFQERKIDIPVVAICSKERTEHADKLLGAGVFDIVNDYEDISRMGQIVDKLKSTGAPSDSEFFLTDCPPSVPIVGKSPAMQKTMRMIRMVASSSCNPVLIVGKTGTGKEMAAEAVHTLRHGSDQKFVAINCAALTANLLESELFGHVKGSFTSADREKTGLLELAQDGTVFLDEISEMPMDLQAKLLRVLQEKTFRKVGGTEEITCNATIIASSNRNLLEESQKGRFRQDLYYRLCICPIHLSPLNSNDRRDDILLLAKYFLKNSVICPEKKGKIKDITKLAAETLLRHPWDGNVRELRNVIERAIMLEQSDRIGRTNIILHTDCFDQDDASDSFAPTAVNDFSLERAEKELIAKALDESGWQKTRAAALLGITRTTLYAKVKQYNIQQAEKASENNLQPA